MIRPYSLHSSAPVSIRLSSMLGVLTAARPTTPPGTRWSSSSLATHGAALHHPIMCVSMKVHCPSAHLQLSTKSFPSSFEDGLKGMGRDCNAHIYGRASAVAMAGCSALDFPGSHTALVPQLCCSSASCSECFYCSLWSRTPLLSPPCLAPPMSPPLPPPPPLL